MQTKLNLRFGILAAIVVGAAMSRLLPHPPNATAVGAMALFGGAYFMQRWQALVLPLVAMWLSDLVLNNVVYKAYNPTFTLFTEGGAFIYGAIALMVLLGWVMLKKVKTIWIVGLLASIAIVLASIVLATLTGAVALAVLVFGAWPILADLMLFPLLKRGTMTTLGDFRARHWLGSARYFISGCSAGRACRGLVRRA